MAITCKQSPLILPIQPPMAGTEPNSFQQLIRVIRHEPFLFSFYLLKNTLIWFVYKYVLRRRFLSKRIHGYTMSFDLTDPGISRSLLLVGDREREHRFMLEQVIKPGTILDLGANIGYYVLMEHKLMRRQGRVIAIEPEPNNFSLLQHNISLNGLSDRTVLINSAVSNQDGTAELFLSKLGNVHSLKQHQTSQPTGRSVTVSAISMQKIAHLCPDITLIRMDIEGYEQEILQTIIVASREQKFKPSILFELHPLKYDQQLFNQVLSELHQIGYQTKYLACSHKDLLQEHQLNVIASIPTDGTVRHIATDVPLSALLEIYSRSRAILISPT